MKNIVRIIGGGLAGTEAAWQLARRGVAVELYEMRPQRMTEAHAGRNLGELVCSNSLRSDLLSAPAGLLKAEMRRLDDEKKAAKAKAKAAEETKLRAEAEAKEKAKMEARRLAEERKATEERAKMEAAAKKKAGGKRAVPKRRKK